MQPKRLPSLALWFALGLGLTTLRAPRADDAIQFNREIRPILSDNCSKCHGPDKNQRQAGLRLDKSEGAIAQLESGKAAIVPGKPGESELLRRITSADESQRMPPPETGKQLTPRQIELLRRWIAEGGKYQPHWSLISPTRPELPNSSPLAPREDSGRGGRSRSDRTTRAIDRFVIARLDKEGLRLSAPADQATLIRRVTYDLTGLPPTPAEVDAFLADNSPEAYEKVVDRLLLSTRFGEHQARYWLDLARYGDTHGLHFDNERALWKYRDWVIGALNNNLPFDRFVTEQLAGDLMPNATLEQRIATGFNRCNVSTSEGGSIDDEVLVRYAVDRTETMSSVFMGLTLGCAVCHDHKFDPVSQKEFYRLYAFFNASADAAMDGNQLAPAPIIKAPSAEEQAKLKQFDDQIAGLRKKIVDEVAQLKYTDPADTKPVDAKAETPSSQPQEFVWIEDSAPTGAQLQGDTPWEFVGKPHPVHSGQKSTRRQAPGLSQHFFTGAGPGLKIGEGDKLFAYVYLDAKNPPQTVMLQFNDGVWEHRAYWGEDKIPFGVGDNANHRKLGSLPKAGEWARLEVTAAAVGLKPGAVLNGWAFTQFGGLVYWDKAGSVTRTPQNGQGFDSLAKWEAYERGLVQSAVPGPVRELIKIEAAKRNDAQKKLVRDYFLENVYAKTRPLFDSLRQQIAEAEKQRQATEAAIPSSMVMADLPQPRPTHVLTRGQYNKKGELVTAGVPAVFPPLPDKAPANRLGLAQWLTRKDHPLTARVAVNRFWQQYFGRGIVKTSEDFGAQGEWPTHPELLDWLSVEFMESGWNVKQLQKLIVMSATYRQASDISAELLRRDPENVLLARGPRFRLDAEVVRDSALYVSGLLTEKIGGRSVRPYQPPGIWEAVAFQGSNTQNYKADGGEALYRRSMYTFWKRTAPPPSLMAFDAPSRENCVSRRGRTNTPLAALALMNDEQYVEASRRLAERMLKEGGAIPADRLAYGFRLATARRPAPRELEVLVGLHAKQLGHYQSNRDEGLKLLAVGQSKRDQALDISQHAAMTMMANLLLNLDEAITKE